MMKNTFALAAVVALAIVPPAFARGGGHGGSHGGGGSHSAHSSGSSHSSRSSGSTGREHTVAGHTTKKGTKVAPHHATNPNDTKKDNYSSKGNVNPHTGKEGAKDPNK